MKSHSEIEKISEREMVVLLVENNEKIHRLITEHIHYYLTNHLEIDTTSKLPVYYQTSLFNTITELYDQVVTYLKKINKFSDDNLERVYSGIEQYFTSSGAALPGLISSLEEAMNHLDQLSSNFVEKQNKLLKKEISNPEIAHPVSQKISEIIKNKSENVKKAWQLFRKNINVDLKSVDGRTQTKNNEEAIKAINNLLESDLKEMINHEKYAVSFKKDPRLQDIVQGMKTAFQNFDINNNASIISLYEKINAVYEVIYTHCVSINPKSQQIDVAEGLTALKKFIIDSGWELKDAIKIEDLALLADGFSNIFSKSVDEVDALIVKPILSQEGIVLKDPEKSVNCVKGRISKDAQILPRYLEIISSQEMLRFKEHLQLYTDNKTKFLNKQPDVDKKLIQNAEKTLPIVTNYLLKDASFKTELMTFVKDPVLLDNLNKINLKPKQPKTFAELRQLKMNDDGVKITTRGFTDRARFKYQIAKVKYALTTQEKNLLSKVIGFPFIDFDTTKDQIKVEILNRENFNNRRGLFGVKWRSIFFPKRTSHLKAAVEYLDYHQAKQEMTKSPEIRLGSDSKELPKHRSHTDFSKLQGKNFRPRLSSLVVDLSWFFSSNRALKKLHQLMFYKAVDANELKKDLSLNKAQIIEELNPTTGKNERDEEVLIKAGYFFEFSKPENLLPKIPAFKNCGPLQKNLEKNDELNHLKSQLAYLKKQKSALINNQLIMNDQQLNNMSNEIETLQVKLNEMIDENLNNLSLEEGIAITYHATYSALSDLKDKSEITDPKFSYKNPDALQKILMLLKEVKLAKEEVVKYSHAFSKLMFAFIEANMEAKEILEKIKAQIQSGGDLSLLFSKAQLAIAYRVDSLGLSALSHEDKKNWDAKFITLKKDKEVSTILSEVKNGLNEADYFAGIDEAIQKLAETIQEYTSIKKYSEGRMKHMLADTMNDVNALKHLADHATIVVKSGARN